MKKFLITIILLLIPLTRVFAHERETEMTNLAKTEWIGPLVAILIIATAITLARRIRRRSSQQITNQ